MAYGDPSYTLQATGATNTSANAAHYVLGNYGGLSNLAPKQVGFLQVIPSGNNARLHPTLSASVNQGVRLMSGASFYTDLPPMKVSALSQLHITNETSGTNASLLWALWLRNPL